MAERTLKVVIGGDAKGALRALGTVGDRTGALSRGMSVAFGAIQTAAKLAVGGLVALAGAGVFAANLAGKQEEEQAKLAQTIKTMGAEAWTSADALQKQATALQGVTKFGDEAIIGLQGVLLTFGNIADQAGAGNDVFSRTTEIALDLSEKLGQDLQTSAIQLGKALNDPIQGVAALRRVGVSFTESQIEQIKTLQESGDLLGAQKMILGELERQFGGTAEAAAQAGRGPFVQLKNILGDIGEEVGKVTLPVLQYLARWASMQGQKLLAWFQTDAGQMWVTQMRGSLQRLAEQFTSNVPKMIAWVERIGKRIRSFIWDAGGIGGVADKVRGWFDSMKGRASELGNGLLLLGGPLIIIARELLPALLPLFEALVPILADIAIDLAPVLAELFGALATHILPGLVTIIRDLADWIGGNKGLVIAITAAIVAFQIMTALMALNPFVLIIAAIIALAALITTHWDKIKAATTAVKDWIVDKFEAVVEFFRKLPGRIGDAVAGMWDGIKTAFKNAVNWVIRKWNDFKIELGGQSIEILGMRIDVPKFTLNTPNIPEFHEGGTFHAPRPGGVGLAVLRDQERVLTPEQASGINFYGDLHFENRLSVDDIARALMWRARTAGV